MDDLNITRLRFLNALGTCKKLERIRFKSAGQQLKWISADLRKLPTSLKDLSIKIPIVQRPPLRPDLPNLERLSLSYPYGCRHLLSQVEQFANLRSLRLKQCIGPKSLRSLHKAKNLEVLRLEPMPCIDAALYQCVQCMPKLQLLQLQGIHEMVDLAYLDKIVELPSLRKVALEIVEASQMAVQAILAYPKIYCLGIDKISDKQLDLSAVRWRKSELIYLGLRDKTTEIAGVNLSEIFLMPKLSFFCIEASTIGYANLWEFGIANIWEFKIDSTSRRNWNLHLGQSEKDFDDVVRQHLVNLGFRMSYTDDDPQWFDLTFGDGDGFDLELDKVMRGQSIDAELKNLGLKSLK